MKVHKTHRSTRGDESALTGEVQKLRADIEKAAASAKHWQTVAGRILAELNEAVEYFESDVEYELADFKKGRPAEFSDGEASEDEDEDEDGEEEGE